MVEVGGIRVLDTEVVNNKGEGDVMGFVSEESVRGGALVVVILGEECAELLVG